MMPKFISKLKLPLSVTVLILLLAVRAWPRITNPEVWDEDGTHNLLGYIRHGFLSIFDPVNGYIIFIPKIITFISAEVSITYYPFVSTVFAWIIIISVLTIITIAPLRLKGGILLAISCLWLPSDPEVYGLPLYTFWWTSLLLYMVVFWDESSTAWGFRAFMVVLASMSAPVILVVLPLFWARVLAFRKNPVELWLAIIASICAAAQLWIMVQYSSRGTVASNIDLISLIQIIPKFLGGYAIGNLLPSFKWPVGIALSMLLTLAIWRARHSWLTWMLVYLWVTAVLMSAIRVDIEIIHQALAGPRYFFFPFALMSWWLLQIALTDRNMYLRAGVWLTLILSAINVLPVIDRNHDDLQWQSHLYSCQYFDNYAIPIHYNGDIALAWKLELSGEQCTQLISTDPLFDEERPKRSVTYPYRIINEKNGVAKNKVIDVESVIENEWQGMDFYSFNSHKKTLPEFQVIGSFNGSNNDFGILRVKMKRGDQIWYRSEPRSKKQFIEIENHQSDFMAPLPSTSDWVLLEFSNINLPENFIVKFIDGGDGWGEWSAIGLRSNNIQR